MALNALYATNVPSQSPSASAALTLDTNQLTDGTAITHTPSSGDIQLTEPGNYEISYSAVATNVSSVPTSASLQFNLDGAVVPGTLKTSTITAASDTQVLAANAIVNVASTSTLTLVANNADASFTNVGVTVRKLD